MTVERIESKRIVRTCPRCKYRGHQRASLFKSTWQGRTRIEAEASCSDCGWTWKVQARKDEWDSFILGGL